MAWRRTHGMGQNVKIAILHNVYRIRGGEERTVDFEHDLIESAGHQVDRFEVLNEDVFGRSRVESLKSVARASWNKDSYRRVRAFVAKKRPDVAHVHNWFPLLSPSIYAALRDSGVPVVQTLHNYRLGCAAGSLMREGKACELCLGGDRIPAIKFGCYRGSAVQSAVWSRVVGRGWNDGTFRDLVDAYISPSEIVASKHIRMGLPSERIHVIRHACIDPYSGPENRRSRPRQLLGDGGIFVGRLVPEKGADVR